MNNIAGDWYVYFYPSNQFTEIYSIKTTIQTDGSVIDANKNWGKLFIGHNQSMIVQEAFNSQNLITLVFDNHQVVYDMFHFSLISKRNHVNREMLNFGFFSRNKIEANMVKEILGAKEHLQLKLQYDFIERISEYVEIIGWSISKKSSFIPLPCYNERYKRGDTMKYKSKSDIQNALLTKKLNYIVDAYIDGGKKELALQTFGYERENTVTNLCSVHSKSSLKKIHMESIERHHKIPQSIWEATFPYDEQKIDQQIETYRAALQQERLSFDDEDSIFQKNQKLFNNLKGVWYAYLYPSNPNSATKTEGIWIVETTIHDDYSVVDWWGNAGYLKIGKNQSLIIKEPYENSDLTVIRFSNRHVSFEHFRFTIVSNQNGTINEMVNFGFYSRKKYSPQEAKEILGEINKVQLKLDLNFDERLSQRSVVRC